MVTHIKGRLLDQAVILFNCVPFQTGTSLKGMDLLPKEANSFLYEQFLISIENHYYQIRWPPLNVTIIFIRHMLSLQMLVILYLEMERRKGFITSGVLFIFWVIVNIIYIIPFYTKLIKEVSTNPPPHPKPTPPLQTPTHKIILKKEALRVFFFLISQPNLSWGYSKELSMWDNSLEHQKYIFELFG